MKSRSRYLPVPVPFEVNVMTDVQITELVKDRTDYPDLLDSVNHHSLPELFAVHKVLCEAVSVCLGFPDVPATAFVLLQLSNVYAVEIAERYLSEKGVVLPDMGCHVPLPD